MIFSKVEYHVLVTSLNSSDTSVGMNPRMTAKFFNPGPDTSLAEMCFVPRRKDAPEGDGYLIGVATRLKENGRSDVILIDAQHPEEGVIATVRMPYRIPSQVHGFWVGGYDLPVG